MARIFSATLHLMCGIGGILRIVKPGDPDYPAAGDPRREPSGAWLWHGLDVRDLHYAPVSGAGSSLAHNSPPTAPGSAAGQASIHKSEASSWFIPEDWLDAMDEKIAWRGPDGAGRFRDRVTKPDGTIVEVALVHRRLSIIDHETGAQPMVVSACPRCAESALTSARNGKGEGAGVSPQASSLKPQAPLLAVVFNGCIYNHRELRCELEADGHEFFTDHSDTEVLGHAWSEWRQNSITRLDGMYAICLWDRTLSGMVASRDLFGEKPLYPIGAQGTFCVTSSMPALLETIRAASGRTEIPLEPKPTADWVALGCTAESTPVRNLMQLAPGGMCGTEVLGQLTRPWWQRFNRGAKNSPRHSVFEKEPLDSTSEVDEMLSRAVQSRLDADVPIGCFLSGGIDSSLIAHYAQRVLGDLRTFCVRMPHPEYDESSHAARVASHLATDHCTLECDATTAAQDLATLIARLGLPFGDSSILPTYWICRAASREVKVALSGDGGDELFAGYDRYRAPLWMLPSVFSLAAMMLPVFALNRADPRSNSNRLARLVIAARHRGYSDLIAIFPTPDLRRLIGHIAGPVFSGWRHFSPDEARRFDLVHYLPADLLRKVDTASLCCGLEVRCPMLALGISIRAAITPLRRLRKNGEAKALLRELARKHLPPGIADRPKQGFAIPISEWFRTDFGGLRTLLLDHLEGDRPFGKVHDVLEINMNFVRQMLDEHWAAGGLTPMHTTRAVRKRDHGQRLFALLSLAIWSRTLD